MITRSLLVTPEIHYKALNEEMKNLKKLTGWQDYETDGVANVIRKENGQAAKIKRNVYKKYYFSALYYSD